MLLLLSPAKRLAEALPPRDLPTTVPRFAAEAGELVAAADALGADGLARLMGISDRLAALNATRFASWSEADPAPAALLFAGDTYAGLEAPSLTDDDLRWAQERLVILSGLYGALRPLDAIRPYRLEMGTAMPTARGRDLYAYWGDAVAAWLAERVAAHEDPTVVNLASEEYARVTAGPGRPRPWIDVVFQDVSGGRARTLGLYAKRARGAMARWAITHRVDRATALRDAEVLGYRFVPAESAPERWIFQRPQPPPVRR